jgi:hypothetical protein
MRFIDDAATLLGELPNAEDDLRTEGPTPARVWGDQWLRVSEKVLRGLNHKLTNRVAALDGVVGVIDPHGDPDPELLQALGDEIRRLHQLLNLYRLMPAESFALPEPVRLQDVIPSVMELHRHHADLREVPCDVEIDPAAAPILVRKSALLRCLLVILESGAGSALRSGRPGQLQLACHSEVSRVFVTISAPCAPDHSTYAGEGSLLHAARSALRHAHGRVDADVLQLAEGPRLRYRLALPALAEARRLQREAAL